MAEATPIIQPLITQLRAAFDRLEGAFTSGTVSEILNAKCAFDEVHARLFDATNNARAPGEAIRL